MKSSPWPFPSFLYLHWKESRSSTIPITLLFDFCLLICLPIQTVSILKTEINRVLHVLNPRTLSIPCTALLLSKCQNNTGWLLSFGSVNSALILPSPYTSLLHSRPFLFLKPNFSNRFYFYSICSIWYTTNLWVNRHYNG